MATGGVTEGRTSYVVWDVGEPSVVVRPVHFERRVGNRIRRAQAKNAGATTGVRLQPGGGWTLAHVQRDLTRIVHTSYSDGAIGDGDVILADGMLAVNTYRKPTDTGMGASGSLLSVGAPAFTKRVAAGDSWAAELTADVTAFGKPTLETADIPMDRVLSGTVTYPAAAAFAIAFSLPGDWAGIDNVLTFYFGGPTNTDPPLSGAGEFCLNVRGDGKAVLFEHTGAGGTWEQRKEFQYAAGGHVGNLQLHTIQVIPYADDRISFISKSVDTSLSRSGLTGQPMMGGHPGSTNQDYYANSKTVSGYTNLDFATGAGPIRLDIRRDLRTFVSMFRLLPPGGGTLVDLPFLIPYSLPADTVLTVRTPGAHIPAGCNLAVTLYDAATDNPLGAVGTDGYLAPGGFAPLYAVIDFTSDPSGSWTPTLWGYEVEVPEATVPRPGANVVGGMLRKVSITGTDTTPDQETASVTIQDPQDQLALLRVRSRLHAQVRTTFDAFGNYSILFEGEGARANARKRGNTRPYPGLGWHEYEVSLVGMWARLQDQLNNDVQWFLEDPTDPQKRPWKVTDIIRTLLGKAGFPSYQIDVPDVDFRLWKTDRADSDDQYLLRPAASLSETIQRLAKDYLGMILLWDANAGPYGMWRLIFNPTPPYNPLALFTTASPGPGHIPTALGAYGGAKNISFIQAGTYRSHSRPPEGNYVRVLGVGQALSGEMGAQRIEAVLFNAQSFDFLWPTVTANPAHPDYLGRFVPIIIAEPTLVSQEAVNWVCKRTFEFACHAQKWVNFRAPLLLIQDLSDPLQARPRPLRIGDAVGLSIDGTDAIGLIRSANPDISRSDKLQFCEYEVLIPTDTNLLGGAIRLRGHRE